MKEIPPYIDPEDYDKSYAAFLPLIEKASKEILTGYISTLRLLLASQAQKGTELLLPMTDNLFFHHVELESTTPKKETNNE